MRISNRVRRNISFVLVIVGVVCIAARAWKVIIAPGCGHAWFELFGILVITYICFDNFQIYRHRIKNGILYGSR